MWHDTPDGARAIFSEAWRWECKIESARLFHGSAMGGSSRACLTALTVGAEARNLARSRRFPALRHLLAAYARSLVGAAPDTDPRDRPIPSPPGRE